MEFDEKQAIYLQIADYVLESILSEKWKEGEKIPSVRDLSMELQVNPNTVMRAYDQLQQEGIIEIRRGIGNFISANARETILSLRREEFFAVELKSLFKKLDLLGVDIKELGIRYDQYLKTKL